MDEDVSSHDEVGTVTVKAESLIKPPKDRWLDLTYKGKPAGALYL